MPLPSEVWNDDEEDLMYALGISPSVLKGEGINLRQPSMGESPAPSVANVHSLGKSGITEGDEDESTASCSYGRENPAISGDEETGIWRTEKSSSTGNCTEEWPVAGGASPAAKEPRLHTVGESITSLDEDVGPELPLTLENVDYMSAMEEANGSTASLSTMDNPVTRDIAKQVFHSRSLVPYEIPMGSMDEDVSTLYGGSTRYEESTKGGTRNSNEADKSEQTRPVDNRTGKKIPFCSRSTFSSSIASNDARQFLCGQRSNLEIFFICVIAGSGITFITLVVGVLIS